jgi:hypothetical protein
MKEQNVKEAEVELENAQAESHKPAEEGKKIDVNVLIEKGKKGKLSAEDLDEAMEEMDFDVDSIDKLYEALEDNGIAFDSEISSEEMDAIESEIERDRARWKQTVSRWENEVQGLRNYFKDGARDKRVLDDIQDYFGLTDAEMEEYFG